MRKKGVSGVIVAVLMVALTMALIAIVWGVVNGIVKRNVQSTESCFGNFGEVNLNSQYTCWDSVNSYLQFSLSIGDIDVDSMIISISGEAETKSFTLNNTDSQIGNVANYGSTGFGTDSLKLPGKNEGKTYLTNYFTSMPDSIKIAPVIGGQQCDVSDTIQSIENCL